jgi:hypothetical protein
MKVVNIYNQTFVGNNSGTNFDFRVSTTFLKTKQDTKWRITVVALGMMFQSGSPKAMIFTTNNLGCSTSAYQLDGLTAPIETTLTLGIINATSNQQTLTYAPTEFLMETLNYNTFNVRFNALEDVNAVPIVGQMVLSLKFEEVYL